MHSVYFMDDDELPEGLDFLLLTVPGGFVVQLRESRLCPMVLEEAWAAYRAMTTDTGEPPRAALSLVSNQ